MSGDAPRVSVEDGLLIVILATSPGAQRVDFDGVVDQTALGEVVGIEILDLRSQLGDGSAPPPPPEGLPTWSYDDEIDAFYIRLADATAPIQRPVVGTAVLDSADRLASLEVEVQP